MIKRSLCEDCGQLYEKNRPSNRWCDTCSIYRLTNAPKPRNEPTKQKTVSKLDIKQWNLEALKSRQNILKRYLDNK